MYLLFLLLSFLFLFISNPIIHIYSYSFLSFHTLPLHSCSSLIISIHLISFLFLFITTLVFSISFQITSFPDHTISILMISLHFHYINISFHFLFLFISVLFRFISNHFKSIPLQMWLLSYQFHL